MTNREFYNAIANAEVSAELKEFALAAIDKLDKENEKRKNTLTKAQKENLALRNEIVATLKAEGQTAAQVAEVFGISTQKASAQLRALVAEGRAVKGEVKVPKKGTVKIYSAVEAVDVDVDAE